jgi:hypothetical protein
MDTPLNVLNEELTEEEIKLQEKEAKLAIKKELLLNAIDNCNLNTLEQRVAWLLNHKPETRKSDVILQIEYWKAFETSLIGGSYIDLDNYKKATRLPSIARSRAVIQNDHKLFLASEDVRKHRGKLGDDQRTAAVSREKPSKSYNVYADESGKTQTYLVVGSFWILNGVGTRSLVDTITNFRTENAITSEFHFKNINKGNLEIHLQLVDLLVEHATTFSFKALYVSRSGIKHNDQALEQLFFNLLCLGVEHENLTDRAPLPRSISFSKDLESEGPDKLMLASIKEKLATHSATKYNHELYLDTFRAVDSKDLIFMQIADLFTSSVNRVLNSPSTGPKDEFAERMLDAFGMNYQDTTFDSLGDCTSILDIAQ